MQYIGTERSEDTLNIFLEYIAGGSIASLIDKFGPLQVCGWAGEVQESVGS